MFLLAWCRQCHPFPVVRHALLSSFGAASQMSVTLTTAAAMLFLGGTIAALKAVRALLMGVQATTGDGLRHSHTSAGVCLKRNFRCMGRCFWSRIMLCWRLPAYLCPLAVVN
jgi:hypothetical protein